jgi:hypothetical protein
MGVPNQALHYFFELALEGKGAYKRAMYEDHECGLEL